ncbi:MAG: putative methyltransferase, partial [Halothiobacillaceae bacterium]
MNTPQQNQPNWDLIAEKFDLWIPQLAPVGEALIKALKVTPGERILDVATGTGEPGFTLARRFGATIHLTAIDAAEGMVRAARNKARAEGLNQVEFHTMAAEAITLPEESFDALLSRFGVMLFTDVTRGLQAMHRVLKPGGRYALAVWST